MSAELLEILARIDERLARIEAQLATPANVGPSPATWPARVIGLLDSVAPRAMRAQDIAEALAPGDPFAGSVVFTVLSKLARAGRLDRLSRGLYRSRRS